MSEFKLGQRVVVTNPTLKSHNQKGWVQNFYGNLIEVDLDNGNMIRIKPGSLRSPLVEADRKTKLFSTTATKHFAMLHLHDDDENPDSLEQAVNEEWDLTCVEDICFGSKEEIKEWLDDYEARDYDNWANAFVVIDSVLYPIEFKKSVSVKF